MEQSTRCLVCSTQRALRYLDQGTQRATHDFKSDNTQAKP
jgi:hypothetical protein